MKASDISGPCFSYDAVVTAALPILASAQTTAPLSFCQSIPFTVLIPLVKALGAGCNGAAACWSSGQRLQTAFDEGPALTELTHGTGAADTDPKVIVGERANEKAVYVFERFAPSADDGYNKLVTHAALTLVAVVQPGGDVGYLTVSSSATGSAETPVYATTIVSKQEALSSHVMWGVLGASDTNDAILMYYDDHIAAKSGSRALPLVQLFSWGTDMYLSRGDVAKGSTGTFGAFHGVTTASKFPTLNPDLIIYDAATMKQLPLTLPALSTTDTDNGASNMRWTLTALPLSDLAAHVYISTYCSAPLYPGVAGTTCVPGAKVCSAWTGSGPIPSTCSQLGELFPEEKYASVAALCENSDMLAAPECACINYAKSTFSTPNVQQWAAKQPALGMLKDAPVQCWLPACVTPHPQTILPRGGSLSCSEQLAECGKQLAATKYPGAAVEASAVPACQAGWTPPSPAELTGTQKVIIGVCAGVGAVLLTVLIVLIVRRQRRMKEM